MQEWYFHDVFSAAHMRHFIGQVSLHSSHDSTWHLIWRLFWNSTHCQPDHWKPESIAQSTKATPLIHQCNNDHITKLNEVLKDIPFGLTVDGAGYPVLCVFASWRRSRPGTDSGMERKQEGRRQKGVKLKLSEDNTNDPDRHPLVTLLIWQFSMRLARNLSRTGFEVWNKR